MKKKTTQLFLNDLVHTSFMNSQDFTAIFSLRGRLTVLCNTYPTWEMLITNLKKYQNGKYTQVSAQISSYLSWVSMPSLAMLLATSVILLKCWLRWFKVEIWKLCIMNFVIIGFHPLPLSKQMDTNISPVLLELSWYN